MAFILKYHGHSCFEIKLSDKSILIDPYLQASKNFDYRNENITDIFVTHAHADHLGSTFDIAKHNQSTVTTIVELANICSRNGVKSNGINFGSWLNFNWGQALFIPASHTSSYGNGEYAGEAAGIIFKINGVTLYHAGDTALTQEMKMIKVLYKPDIALLPVGGFYTMDIEHAIIAAKWIGAKITIPMHYNTFSNITVDIKDFEIGLQTHNLNYHIMEPETTLEF